MPARNGLGDGAERGINFAAKGEARRDDDDFQKLSLVFASDGGAGPEKPRRASRKGPCTGGARWPGGLQARVGIPGKFLRAQPGSFGQAAVGGGLQPPGDPSHQPGLIAGARGFTEDVTVAGAQRRYAELGERREFGFEVGAQAGILRWRLPSPQRTVSTIGATSSRQFQPKMATSCESEQAFESWPGPNEKLRTRTEPVYSPAGKNLNFLGGFDEPLLSGLL